MKVLIVNADDFGLSRGVNRGIAISHERGIVTSASLMVRRPAVAAAAAYARRHPALSVGLHVDLGEWVFHDGAWKALDQVREPVDTAIRQQIEQFVDLLGRKPTHLDSHQHVHRTEPLASMIRTLARELAIPVRGSDPRVKYCGEFYGQGARGEPCHDAISVQALVDLIDRLPDGISELGCHPGIGTDDDSTYGVERSMEVRALCSPLVRERIRTNGISLLTFEEIA